MKKFKSILFIFASLLGLSSARAAVTADIECVDSKGLKVYWESKIGTLDDDGDVMSERLYRGRVTVSAGKLEIAFMPDQYLTQGEPALLAAWKNDGQYIVINALRRHEGREGEHFYTGTMKLRLKTRKGLLKRSDDTKVRCSISGEA